MGLLAALLLGLAASAAAAGAPCTPMRSNSCWHSGDPETHVARLELAAANETAAACLCFAKCGTAAGCAHWHVRKSGGGKWECDLRTAAVHAGKGTCLSDAAPAPSPGPSPGPGPPGPPNPYPPTPVPPPSPPPQPPLGYKPHLVFHLVDDVGHYNFGFRGNKEARTPHIDSLVAQGLILERQYVFKVRALLREVSRPGNRGEIYFWGLLAPADLA